MPTPMTYNNAVRNIFKRIAPTPSSIAASNFESVRTSTQIGKNFAGSSHESHSRLQQLYDFAKIHLGRDRTASQENVKELCQLMSCVTLEELGFDSSIIQEAATSSLCAQASGQSIAHQSPKSGGPIIYLHIYEDEEITLGIFCFPPNSSIPLHNHPGMTVFSRLLYGTMHVKAYDWADVSPKSSSRMAQLITDTTVTAPTQPFVLFPSHGGNIHSFTALSHCAVLDLLTPPYEPEAGRDCTYYREKGSLSKYGPSSNRPSVAQVKIAMRLVELEEYDPPDFEVVRGTYSGIHVTEL